MWSFGRRVYSPPCLMMPYNPAYYPSLFEGFGLKKVMDLYAYLLEKSFFGFDRLNRITERLKKREPRLRIRPIQIRHFDKELQIIKEIYNEAWSRNWGFVPLTEAEIDDVAKNLNLWSSPTSSSLPTGERSRSGFRSPFPITIRSSNT